MSTHRSMCALRFVGIASTLLLYPGWLAAAGPAEKSSTSESESEPKVVELFAGIESGELSVKFIAKSSKEGRVLIRNKTERPLTVALPEAVAAVPVLGQFLPFDGGNQQQNNNRSQQTGVDMNNNPFDQNDFFNNVPPGVANDDRRGGFFNLPPERLKKFRVRCVCLEHGRPNPRAAIPYELRPLESVISRPEVRSMLEHFAREALDRRVVQAAVWHLNNDLSWKDLADKRIRRIGRPDTPFFTRSELKKSRELVEKLSQGPSAKTASSPISASRTTADSRRK